MPINAGVEYGKAEQEYLQADTPEEKLACLKKMLSVAPSHKSAEKLQKGIKERIKKLNDSIQKSSKKGSFQKISIKREGAALISIVGPTNSGKSTLLNKLTNANTLVAGYEFTTKKPVQGILDYHGIKLQLIEIPAIIENFSKTENGPSLLSLVKSSDLIIFMFNSPKEKSLLDKELSNINVKRIIYNNEKNFTDIIWKSLSIIKVYTKQPGKPKDYPPVALRKNSIIRDLAEKIHKDFLKNFKYAVINGSSAKFPNMRCGLSHKLQDDDVIEFHIK